jgi:uncharacterized protein YcfL
MKLFYVYDNQGFEAAKAQCENEDVILSHETHIIHEMAGHDLSKGFCDSYQVFLENGEIVFNSEMEEVA